MVEITRGTPLAVESGTMLDRLERALRDRNIHPDPACRYSHYRKILQARSRRASHRAPTQEQQYATAELFQMDWIVACFVNDDSKWPLIKEAFFQDPPVPTERSAHSPGRDRQFELYVAARFHMAGMPISFSEPDIRTSLAGWPFVVAAKRVKSRNRFLRRIKSARDQIHTATADGIIAIDYSLVAALEKSPYFIGDLDAGHTWAEEFSARQFHAQWLSVLRAVSQTPEVFGALIFVRLFQLHPNHHTQVISELLFSRALCENTDPRTQKMLSMDSLLRRSVIPDAEAQ